MSGASRLLLLILFSLSAAVASGEPSFPDVGPNDHLERGVKLYREGDLDRAATELKRAVGLDPKLVAAHYHLAKIHLIRKDPYRAFYALREVVGLEPSNAKARRALQQLSGELLTRVQDDIRARRNLAVAYNVMGFLLIQQNRLAAGVKREEFALELDPKMAEAYDDLAWAAYKDRDLERAFEMVSKAFELDPTKGSIAAHYQQLFNLKRLGVPFEARKEPRPPPQELASAAVSDVSAGHPPVDAGALSGVLAPPRASDLETLVAEDRTLVEDYLKNADLMAQAPRGRPAFIPSPAASAAPLDPKAEAARKKKVSEATAKALQESYDLARKKEASGDLKGAMQLYVFIRSSDPGFQDVAVRMYDIEKTVDALRQLDSAVQALKSNLCHDALSILQGLDRTALERGSKIKSLDNLLGEAAYGARQYDLAKVHLRKWLDTHQDDAGARYLLVKTLQAQSDWPEALSEISTLIAKHPEATSRYPDLYSLKAKFWVKSYFAIVIALAFIWGALSSGYVYVKVKRGSRFRQVRRLIERVQLAVKKEKWADVIRETDKLPTGLPLQPAEEVFLGCATGMALLSTGDLPKATKLQRELLAAFPEEPQVHHLTARIMLINRDFSAEAIEEYHKLLSVEPNNRALLEALNSHYQARAPESEEAMKILDRLLELDPTNPDFRYYRALRHLRQKDFTEVAKAAYTRVLEIDPQRADVRAGLARCHFEARNYLEAIKEAKRALEVDLRSPELHRILLTSYARLQMQAEAIKEYRQLVSRHPEMPELKSYLEQVEQLRGSEFGDDSATREAAALYEKGVRAHQEGRHKEAIGPLTAAFNSDELRQSAGTLLVRSYLKLREIRTAVTIFERLDVLTARTPDDFVLGLCYDMAEVYLKENKRDKALELYTYICRANVSYRDAFQRLEALQSGDVPA